MTFHVFNGDSYVGIVTADNEEEAKRKASKHGSAVTVRQVQYRNETPKQEYDDWNIGFQLTGYSTYDDNGNQLDHL